MLSTAAGSSNIGGKANLGSLDKILKLRQISRFWTKMLKVFYKIGQIFKFG